jgi:uncharacterized protein involved in cysteine biosynthesis
LTTTPANPRPPQPGVPAGDTRWSDLRHGVGAPWRGLRLLAKTRALWPWAVVPTALGLTWSFLVGLQLAAGFATGGWLLAALAFLAGIALSAALLIIQTLLALASPILDLLSEETEEAVGARAPGPGLLRELATTRFWLRMVRALIEALKLLGLKLILAVLVLPLSFLPVVGPLVGVLATATVTAIDFLDYPLARRDLALGRKLRWLAARPLRSIGFSLATLAWISIPIVGGLMLAPAVIGGTLLVLDDPPTPDA